VSWLRQTRLDRPIALHGLSSKLTETPLSRNYSQDTTIACRPRPKLNHPVSNADMNRRGSSRPVLVIGMRVLAVFFLAAVCEGDDGPSKLEWHGVAPHYLRFDQIRPTLSNVGEASVFLSRLWPHGSAQLQRLNETSKRWESGMWTGGCGTVADAAVPIEIHARSERPIQVYWQRSTDDWDSPKQFVVGSGETRPLPGTYRLILRYAIKPWTIVHAPGTVYVSTSPEFSIAK
jgi:hypothetical protein